MDQQTGARRFGCSTDGDEDEHPLVRLIDHMPIIRFACQCDSAGSVHPVVVRCGDGLIEGESDGERWRKLVERIHPEDRGLLEPPETVEPVRGQIRLRRGKDLYRGYAFAHHLRAADAERRLWEGLLAETIASISEAQLSAIMQHLPSVLYRCVIERGLTRCTFVSPAVSHMLGLSPGDVVDHPERILGRIHPEDCDWLGEDWYAAAARKELFDREFRVVMPGGEVKWLRSIAQMTEGDDEAVLADGIAADITGYRQIQEQLERRNRELLTLCRISEIALNSPSVAAGLDQMAREISRHMNFPTTVIAIYDERAQVVTVRGCHNVPHLPNDGPVRLPIRHTLAWDVIRTGRVLIETDALARSEPRFKFMRLARHRTFIGIPIKVGGRAIGCLGLGHPDRLDPGPEVVELLASWADSISSFIASKGQEELAPGRQDERDLEFEAAFVSRLTPRQREVLAILASGRSNRAIAEQLGLQEATVKIHVRAILKALGVRNRTQAATIANSLGRRGPARAGKRPRKARH